MTKTLFVSFVFVLAGLIVASPVAAQKITYKGPALKNVTFEYDKTWELVQRPEYIFIKLRSQPKVYVEIGEEPNKESMAEVQQQLKETPRIKKTKFNGYDAYIDPAEGTYMFYRGKMKYFVLADNPSKDPKIAAQVKALMASIKFK
jgi:hypothetical protein